MLLSDKMADADPKPDKWRVQKRWNRTHVDARRAHRLVARALRDGSLTRGKCWCGSLRVEAHHPDYAEPLTVIWLCRRHHLELHADARRAAE